MNKEQRAMDLVAIEEKVAFYLLAYGFNMKKNINQRKEGSIRSFNPLQLIKRV